MERLNRALIVGKYKGEDTNPTSRWFVSFKAFYAYSWTDFEDIILWDEQNLLELKACLSKSIIEKCKIPTSTCPIKIVCLTRLNNFNPINTSNRRSQ